MKKLLMAIIAFTSLCCLTTQAPAKDKASIIVMPKKIFFNHGKTGEKRSKIMTVKNLGTQTAYVLMNVFDMRKTHQEQTQKETLKKSFGLLAFPRKMAIKPGQSKRISITDLLKNIKVERDFELQFRTVKSLKDANIETNEDIPVGIQVDMTVVKYAHVYVLPKEKTSTYQVVWNKNKKVMEFKNTGTLSLKFFASHQCYKEQCTRFQDVYIPAGETKEVKLPLEDKGQVAMKVSNSISAMPQFNKTF